MAPNSNSNTHVKVSVDPPPARSTLARIIGRGAFLVVLTVGCFAVAGRDIELAEVWRHITTADIKWLVLVPVLLTIQVLVRATRMHLLLSPMTRPSLRDQTSITAIGFMAINLVPFRLGELVRPWLLAQQGVSWAESAQAVVIERTLDLIALLIMLLLVTWVVPMSTASSLIIAGIDVVAAAMYSLGIVITVLLSGLFIILVGRQALVGVIHRLPVVGRRLGPFVARMHTALHELSRAPLRLTGAVLLTVLVWLGTIAVMGSVLTAFVFEHARVTLALMVTVATIAGTLVLPTPGFFGSFEMSAKAALIMDGLPPNIAGAIAVVWHISTFAYTIGLGAAFVLVDGVSWTKGLSTTPDRIEPVTSTEDEANAVN